MGGGVVVVAWVCGRGLWWEGGGVRRDVEGDDRVKLSCVGSEVLD